MHILKKIGSHGIWAEQDAGWWGHRPTGATWWAQQSAASQHHFVYTSLEAILNVFINALVMRPRVAVSKRRWNGQPECINDIWG